MLSCGFKKENILDTLEATECLAYAIDKAGDTSF